MNVSKDTMLAHIRECKNIVLKKMVNKLRKTSCHKKCEIDCAQSICRTGTNGS